MLFALLFGIIQGGLLLWTQAGLQHGTEMAARCAAINSSTSACGTSYVAQEAFDLNQPPSTLTVNVSKPACGYQVSANYTFQFVTSFFGVSTLALTAQSCFPAYS